MKRCVLVLDGPEKNETLRKEFEPSDVVVAVDEGLSVCLALNRPPRVAFFDPGTVAENASDWAAFVGVEREEYRPSDGQDGLELALEWALTTPDLDEIAVVNALGRSPALDLARLTTVARHRDGDRAVTVLTATHRYSILSRSTTINGRPGLELALIPMAPTGSAVRIVNGRESRHADLQQGSTVLTHLKLKEKVANLEVSQGWFLLVVPRSRL
jgi:hypothetical protein